nr:ATP-binding cassette transporter Abcb1-like12 [Brachionus angularis]
MNQNKDNFSEIDLGIDNCTFEYDENYEKNTNSIRNQISEIKNNQNSDEICTNKHFTILDLYRYSDLLDKVLMLIGTIAAIASAVVYPLMFLSYGQVAGTFVDLIKYENLNKENFNITAKLAYNQTINKCYELSNKDTHFNNRIDKSIIYYIIFGLSSILVNYIAYACFDTAAERQIKRIRNKLFESLLRQEIAFYDKNAPGELNSKITSNIDTLKLGMGFKIPDFISLVGRGIGCFIYAMISAWKFSIVFLAIMPFISASTSFLITFIKKFTISELKSYGIAGNIAQEVLSSIRTVVSFGLMKKEIKNYENNLLDAEKMSIKKGLYTGFFTGFSLFLFNCVFAIGIYYGTYLSRTDCKNYSPSDILRSLMLMITATFSIGQGLPFLKDLAEARGAAKSIFEIINKKSSIDINDYLNKIKLNNLSGNIKFVNVSFSYPERKEVEILKDLNLEIQPGKTIALCGASGNGKSTIIQLLQRFYDPISGIIKLDDYDIKGLDLEWLRSQMALVSQEPILFSTTIKENIRLGRLNATDEDIIQAAKSANAHDFIMGYPDKYDTNVGERGSQLSVGQKQRIAIARAILRNPKILLLDEATSALDYESEKIVQDALDKVKVGRTTIIIAHRLSTIRNADLIVGLSNGQVKEIGTHEELIKLKGIYYDLLMSQNKEPNLDKKKPSVEKTEKEIENDSEYESETESVKETEKEIKYEKNESNLQNKKSKTNTLKLAFKISKYHAPEKIFVILGALSQLFASIVNPIVSLIFCEIYTIFAIPNVKEQERLSLKYMGIIFIIALGNFIGTILFNYSFSLIGARLTKRLRVKMFESYLRQEMAYHDLEENKSSILATHLASCVPFCKGLTSDLLSLLCQAISSVGFSIIVGLVINWKLCLVIMSFIPLNFLSGFLNIESSTNKRKGESNEEIAGRLTTEIVENIKTVVSLGKERYFYEEFTKEFNKKYKKLLFLIHIRAFLYSISNSVLFFIQAAAFSYGYSLVINENLKVNNLFRVYSTITFSSMALGRLFAQMPDTKKARNAAKTVLRAINRKSKIDSMSENGIKLKSIKGDIQFLNVKFNYPNRPDLSILNGLNLNLKPGESNALVGPSGCGKSTTIALLMRFYDANEGTILIDNVDIKDLHIGWLRSKIGFVSQEPILFNTSIKENISNGKIDQKVLNDEIIKVAKAANIHERISSLPEKYDTIVGNKGGKLSGGEKQRLAIARALIREPNILLLDEATSALDNQSESIVQDALDKAQIGRTCLIIAHRLSTIQNSNKISVIKDGIVLEEGTHDQLIKQKGFYYKLQMQKNFNL